ncbi:MAG: alpha/beta fold hydrolase [Pirellulales bacterium]|nr:alpha/beta fold hydrolase [Pirellulales bacterium]
MSTPPIQLVLLPGLGADARLFRPQAAVFGVVVPPWIPPRRSESLPDYAERLAGTVDVRRPFILGGVSIGGMIAYEMARHLQPDALVLIASCRKRESLPPWHRLLGGLAPAAPDFALAAAKRLAPVALWGLRRFTPDQRRLLAAMFRESDNDFLRWGLGAIARWRPSPPADVPTFQIHGLADRMIPASRAPADRTIPGGAHLINLTHADQVNAWLAEVMDRVG